MKKIALPILIAVFAVMPFSKLHSQDNHKLIKDYITATHLRDYKKADLTNFIIDNVDPSKSLQADVVKFQQSYNGVPIYNSVGTALIKEGKVVYYNDTFLKNYNKVSHSEATVGKNRALELIAQEMNIQDIKNYPVLNFSDADPETGKFVKQQLLYVEDHSDLKLAYQYTFQDPKSPNYWEILINAHTGDIIAKNDLNLSCSFHPGAYSHDHSNDDQYNVVAPTYETKNQAASFLLPDNATYNIFPLPVEAPTFGSRSLVSNPWLTASSPEGWHYDGTSRYTYTRGNNVYAYSDHVGNNTVGATAEGGAARNFDFPFSIYETPVNNRNASITNLFYVSNMIHDVFYKFGFTETARNFQQSNFGILGGLGNDAVNAEAQDGGGTNNANFATPADGSKPRMQMYLWSTVNRVFFYNTPAVAVPRQPTAGTAQFGNALTPTGVTGNVQLSSVIDGCTAIPAGSLSGKIGLIERGTCDFVTKVKNAQNAGATAAVIYNAPTSGAVGGMAGTDATITIPSVLISNSEGEYIKNQLSSNVTVNITLKNDPATAITPDGSFDNGIVIHEYGHGISNRLTGNGSTCLQSSLSKEQMGEGWSDFFALMLTNKPGDNATVARGMATYASGQATSGSGIRPAQYSPNFAVNDYTYADTNGMEYLNTNSILVPDVHSIGFVWASMLWDLHWNYADKYGYSSHVTANPASGSARVLQLITDALKLQPCSPTFIDGRTAILAAEQATTQGADRCMIWRTFAKRGLGVGASAGSKTNINDQVQDFSVPADCVLSTDEVKPVKTTAISLYPNPAKDEFFINFPDNTLGKVNVEIYDMSGKLISSENKISPDSKKAISTYRLVNGTYIVNVKGLGIDSSSKIIIKK